MVNPKGDPVNVIVGLGDTGLSVARYFARTGQAFQVVDSRANPPGLAELQRLYPQVQVELGEFRDPTLGAARQLVVSPGVSVKTDAIARARQAGVPVTGDIDIFAQSVDTPILAVTGSNGKSTVVAMLAAILRQAGKRVGLGGNLDGINFKPALDLLTEGEKDFYVLELSSFQLETTRHLGAEVAAVLNVSPDHMDRYTDMDEYRRAKQRIFTGCKQLVINRDDATSLPPPDCAAVAWDYGLDAPGANGLGLVNEQGQVFIATAREKLLAVADMKVVGQHNVANALAAMTMAMAAGIEPRAISAAMREFTGLPHRCQWVASIAGVDYYNDSKGTNVGATMAAVEGLGLRLRGRIVLIAGGMGKGADFSLLAPAVQRFVKTLILIGEDAQKLAASMPAGTTRYFEHSMQEAVNRARQEATTGDAVLLSPACASFDMFDNFQHRGQVFTSAVENLQ